MRVFVYEFATGGGFWHLRDLQLSGTLLAEGRAMSRAVTADFAGCDEIEVMTTRDARLPAFHPGGCSVVTIANSAEEWAAIERLSAKADWTLLIAPETAGALVARSRLVESCGGRLLCPSAAFAEITTNKQTTAETLRRAGVAVPRGYTCSPKQPDLAVTYPVVEKPIDGCGSQDIRLIHEPADPWSASAGFRYEEFIPGLPASVAVLCGPAGSHALPCCEQRLSRDGRFTYLGGRLPLSSKLSARAQQLALAAVSALPEPRGYVGVDLVLGETEDGSADRVIEINPRLTTSYVGLRAASQTNLAAAMLAVATGSNPRLCFSSRSIEFTADGKILE